MDSKKQKAAGSSVTVTIRYLVSIRDKAGKGEERVSFPQGSSLKDVAGWLASSYGIKLPDPGVIAILNGKGWAQYPEELDTKIKDGDVVSLFPPISGG